MKVRLKQSVIDHAGNVLVTGLELPATVWGVRVIVGGNATTLYGAEFEVIDEPPQAMNNECTNALTQLLARPVAKMTVEFK